MSNSPYGTPRGYGHRKFSNKFNNSHEKKDYFSYRHKSFDNTPPKGVQSPVNDDFIPFDTSSPVGSERRKSGQFFRPRGRRNNSFHSFNSSYNSPGSCNSSYSPGFYVDASPSNFNRTPRGGRHSHQYRTPLDQVPISKFIDLEEMLKDPWMELEENFRKRRSQSDMNDSTQTTSSSDQDSGSVNDSVLGSSVQCSPGSDQRTSDLSICDTLESANLNKSLSN